MKSGEPPIIVMDVEWTAWSGSRRRQWSGPGEEMELVQIGAVKLADTPGLEETGAFEVLIRPRINPRLDSYFMDLTGISQNDLDREGMDLKDALALFTAFADPAKAVLGFGDELSHIEVNCQLYGLINTLAGRHCADARSFVMPLLGSRRTLDSSDLPMILGFTPPGRAHQGLADSRCVAEALRRARKAGRF